MKLRNESQCHKKRSYFSFTEAGTARDRAESKRGVKLRIYKCPCCLQWHLTKAPELRNKERAR